MNYLYVNVLIEKEDQQEITASEGIDFIEELDNLLEKHGYVMAGARVSLVSEKAAGNTDIAEQVIQDDNEAEDVAYFSEDSDDDIDEMLISSRTKPDKKTRYN